MRNEEWIIVITDNGQKTEKNVKEEEDYPVYEKGWSNMEVH